MRDPDTVVERQIAARITARLGIEAGARAVKG